MALVELERANQVAVVTINRPEVLNALNPAVLTELSAVTATLAGDRDVWAVVVTGAGGRAFVAGADIRAMADLDPAGARRLTAQIQDTFTALAELPQPVIAALAGWTLGGGCELALACDIRVADETVRIGQPEVSLGILPGAGGTQRLVRLVGPGTAKLLVLGGEPVDGKEALRLGLVDRLVPAGRALAEARRLADVIASRAPQAVAAAKVCIDRGADAPLSSGLALERAAFAELFASSDQKEGMAAFLAKRPAHFTGR